ncbi:MAG: hypothetical protein IPJ23_19050 [Ignavibacteriales bacterium]|nr:hypothetical protein [Ignavibacteriales bacterium]
MSSLIRTLLIALVYVLLISFYQNPTLAQVGITFKFANPVLTNVLDDHFLEFDITAEATANSQFKIAQLYINYNTLGFGSNLVTNGNITVTEGILLTDTFLGSPPSNFGAGNYSATVVGQYRFNFRNSK